METFADIDSYISSFPVEVQSVLKKMRTTIRKSAPKATEAISYGMPTYKLNGNLVHFAAFKKHIGFYPGPAAILKFEKKLKGFKTSKGAIQFPLGTPVPYDVVAAITKFRVKEQSKAK